MEVLIILVPVSLGLSLLALGSFLWTLRHSQYDDLEGDAWRILLEDADQTTDKEAPHPPNDTREPTRKQPPG